MPRRPAARSAAARVAAARIDPRGHHASFGLTASLLRDGNQAQEERYLPAIAADKLRMQSTAANEAT